MVWNDQLGKAFELSSMGIRVDESALRLQVGLTGDEGRLKNGLAPRFIKREITINYRRRYRTISLSDAFTS